MNRAKEIDLRVLDLENHDQRLGYLKSQFDQLRRGDVFDWSSNELFEFIEILDFFELNEESRDVRLHFNGLIRRDPIEDYDRLEIRMPEYFNRLIKSDQILSREEMKSLTDAGKEAVFQRLFSHFSSYGLGILPEYQNETTRELEENLLKSVQDYVEIDNDKLREELGERSYILQLESYGKDIYTREVRFSGAEQSDGGIEYKVNKATEIGDPKFMVRKVHGYHGILRYTIEEMARIAPEGANAFLDGTAISRSIQYNGMWSPIISGNVIRPANQPDGQYHVIPVKFFNVEIDKDKKYESFSKSVAHDEKTGKPYAFQEFVRERGKDEVVSKSDNVMVFSS